MKALLVGSGVALAAGLLSGGAMRPDLLYDGRPAGPQAYAGWTGEPTGPFDPGISLAAYRGRIPDYVIATHPPRPRSPQLAALPQPVEPAAPPEPQDDEVELAPAAYHADGPPETPVTYPSLGGA